MMWGSRVTVAVRLLGGIHSSLANQIVNDRYIHTGEVSSVCIIGDKTLLMHDWI